MLVIKQNKYSSLAAFGQYDVIHVVVDHIWDKPVEITLCDGDILYVSFANIINNIRAISYDVNQENHDDKSKNRKKSEVYGDQREFTKKLDYLVRLNAILNDMDPKRITRETNPGTKDPMLSKKWREAKLKRETAKKNLDSNNQEVRAAAAQYTDEFDVQHIDPDLHVVKLFGVVYYILCLLSHAYISLLHIYLDLLYI